MAPALGMGQFPAGLTGPVPPAAYRTSRRGELEMRRTWRSKRFGVKTTCRIPVSSSRGQKDETFGCPRALADDDQIGVGDAFAVAPFRIRFCAVRIALGDSSSRGWLREMAAERQAVIRKSASVSSIRVRGGK